MWLHHGKHLYEMRSIITEQQIQQILPEQRYSVWVFLPGLQLCANSRESIQQ